MLLTIARILSLITSWLFPISIFVVVASIVVDLLKKRFYWSKFALIFFIITVILLVIQIQLIYRVTGDILNNPSNETVYTEATRSANWKTYTNKKHNYSLQHPQGWEVKWLAGDVGSAIDNADLIELSSSTEQEYTFEVVSLKSNVFNSSSIEEFSKQLDKFGWRGNPIVSKEKTTLDGVEAVRYTTKEVIAVRVIKPTAEDKIYIYDVSLQGENPKQQTITIFNTILSTFKFTKTSSSATCRPRPACLDAEPKCLIAETADMCPPAEGKFCGGIAGVTCPSGYKCQLDGSYPAAGGKCIKL